MIKELTKLRESELGFTLIEVMVVIIMVGILAAIAVPIYSGYVYRARASEGVTTLGAIKTFMIERRNATNEWPEIAQLLIEFNDFRELYYFEKPPNITITYGTDRFGNRVAVKMITSSNFGLGTGATPLDLQINIDWAGVEANQGWNGLIRERYARHLPVCSNPL